MVRQDAPTTLSSFQCRPQIAVPQAVCLLQISERTRHFMVVGPLRAVSHGGVWREQMLPVLLIHSRVLEGRCMHPGHR